MVNKPHPHLNLIIKWASDPQNVKVQYCSPLSNSWQDASRPTWSTRYNWRIKPEPKPDLVLTAQVYYSGTAFNCSTLLPNEFQLDTDNVEFTFDGETKQLKSVRMI